MTDLEDTVRAQGLLAAGRPVVVMYSGGRDSTCLLDVAVRIAGAPAVSALHVNYGLRGTADADERHCASVCEQLGIQLKDRRLGLVDFPSEMAGRRVLLCWRLGEPEVQFWHEADAGYAARQPLSPAFVG